MFRRTKQAAPAAGAGGKDTVHKTRLSRWRKIFLILLILVALFSVAQAILPFAVRWYVNRALDRSLLYHGRIGLVEANLLRGAYTLHDVRLFKILGNVPVPFFTAKRVNLAIQSDALLQRRVVGQITMIQPELNFVAAQEGEQSQTGAGTPWLQIIQDLFPFKINSARIQNGAIHFRAFDTDPPVDVYLSHVDGSIDDLTNIHDQTAPLVSTIHASALAMEQARLQFSMKLDPFSYYPTFQLAVRLLNMDVTKLNALTRAYGSFDMKRGWFDLVIEMDAHEGQLSGYVKPLFRDLEVFDLKQDVQDRNPLEFFWQALVGLTAEVFKNQQRNQFGTLIPFHGEVSNPQTDLLAVIGNALRNAFVRAYLPRYERINPDLNDLEFGTGSVTTDPNTLEDGS